MEKYQGVKFHWQRTAKKIAVDHQLKELDRWVHIFAELGLTPVHAEGAYGNFSYKTGRDAFIITRTGMIPQQEMDARNYCQVESYDQGTFFTKGLHAPSSESFLHLFIYRAFAEITTIMHGHSSLLNHYAGVLDIPVTSEKYPYGTAELAQSAVDIFDMESPLVILKDHGFVAIGHDINTTAKTVLRYYTRLLDLLLQ